MKIKIELSKTESKKARRAAFKVYRELHESIYDEPISRKDQMDIREEINDAMCTKVINSKVGQISIINDNDIVTYEFDLKTKFTNSLINLVEIFYSNIAKFINNTIKPLSKFIEDWFE